MMNKNKYLMVRNNAVQLLYEHYVKMFDVKKHGYMLNQMDFVMFLSNWCDINKLYEDVVNYYDSKHNVIVITDSNNKFIAYA